MVKSMTGYGRAEAVVSGLRLTAEVRSVNHRYSEFSIRLPRAFAILEPDVKKLMQASLARGSISLAVSGNGGEASDLPEIDQRAADHYHRLLNTLRQRYRMPDPVELEDLLKFSEIFRSRQAGIGRSLAWSMLRPVLERALVDLSRMRIREGAALERDFRRHLAALGRLLAAIRKSAPLRLRRFRDSFARRIEKLAGPGVLEPSRLAQEAAIYADRCDISEECVRLASHLDAFKRFLAGPGPVGRRLDFLLQEINREVNTIGSKAGDDRISQQVVKMKEILEKMREQAQNVE